MSPQGRAGEEGQPQWTVPTVRRDAVAAGAAIVGFTLLGLSIRPAPLLVGAFAMVGTAAIGWALFRRTTVLKMPAAVIFFAGVVLIMDGAIFPRFRSTPDWPRLSGILAFAQIAWICILSGWHLSNRLRRASRTVFATVLLLAATTGILIVAATPDPAIDVFQLHERATTALIEGQNPYTDIAVDEDYRSDTILRGYPYPPVPLLSFTVSSLGGLDPRYATVAAWVVALAILGTTALRTLHPHAAIGILILMAAQPGWPGVLILGWTEPLVLPWLTLGVLLLRRNPTVAALALGLGMASKQYYLALVPIFFMMQDRFRWRRILLMSSIAVVTALPFYIASPAGFVEATVVYLAELPQREDSANLIGLLASIGIEFPLSSWVAPLLAGAVAAYLGGRIRESSKLLATGMGVTLGILFSFSTQALESYWFLVFWVLAVAMIASSEPDTEIALRREEEP